MSRAMKVFRCGAFLAFVYFEPWARSQPVPVLTPASTPATREVPDKSGNITVALITALGTVAVAVVGAGATIFSVIWAQRQKDRADRLEIAARTLGKGMEAQLLDRYGFRAEMAFTKIEILNNMGDALITRGWRGIEILQDVTIASIPMKAFVDSPQGRLVCPPTLTAMSSEGRMFPKEVSLVQIETTDRRCVYAIEIAGALTRQDPRLDLTTRLEMKAGYVMSYEELAIAYRDSPFKKEYHSFWSDIPTQILELEIVFPTGFHTKAFPGVFLLGTESMHASELKRASQGFQEFAGGAKLRVEDPLLGFDYLIYWTPPHKVS